jgi:diguanylate cyclase (GGDEF)-like protein
MKPEQILDSAYDSSADHPPRPRLMIVDDQPINLQTLFEIFKQDHEVFIATSGAQALELCYNIVPDLVLLDIIMPDMDGLDVCRQLKANQITKDIPIIFVTSQDNPDDETRGLNAGAVDFISKPVNPAVVRARVKTQLTLKAQSDLLRSLVFIDGLTGVANRRHFNESLEAEWRRCRRMASSLTIFLIDIDHFKLFNDNYGHQAGDFCLQSIAGILKNEIQRSHDMVARYGGEEFVCILPETKLSGAIQKARDMLRAVSMRAIPHKSSPTADIVTISLGAAICVPNHDHQPEELITLADTMLYQAKENGRNQFCWREL